MLTLRLFRRKAKIALAILGPNKPLDFKKLKGCRLR